MIKIRLTQKYTGLEISGDYSDFDELYEALASLVGIEGEYTSYKASISRISQFGFELQQAMKGERDYVNEMNGVYHHTHNVKDIILPQNNVHLSIKQFLPEALFILMSLNDLLHVYAMKLADNKFTPLSDDACVYNVTINMIRLFQSAIVSATMPMVSENRQKSLLSKITEKHHNFCDYHSQYIDMLNIIHINMTEEERLDNLPLIIENLYEKNDMYNQLSDELEDASIEYNCSPSELRFVEEYPEDIVW